MTELFKPKEVVAIENWLKSTRFEVDPILIEKSPYEISARKKINNHKFEVHIDCDIFQRIVRLTVQCATKIILEKKEFIQKLLNCINSQGDPINYVLTPSNMKLAGSITLNLFNPKNSPQNIAYQLCYEVGCSIEDITKINDTLKDNIGLKAAVHRMVNYIPIEEGKSE
jgi:hypothetical protein